MKIWPWDEMKCCPKCGHPNLTGSQLYLPAKDGEPECLRISCSVCSHKYAMSPKKLEES